ncbi:MAG: L-2-amino-thiazoline-4-carboxylic acid hydrolase [Candidatus Thorarchaeota archaeon]
MTQDNHINYYVKNNKKFQKQFRSIFDVVEKVISPKYSSEIVEDVLKTAQIEFNNILTRLTYVGGDKSPYTPLMIQSAISAAFCKASKSHQIPNYEMGKFIYGITENYTQSMSPIKKWIYRKVIFSKKIKNEWKYWLRESQKGKYLDNWVGEFIEGDGKNFEYGFNFTECGWLKLTEKESLKDIAPYICLCDYARMRAIGIGFKRTKTLAAGAECCDFRFIKNYKTPKGWPPESLDENKDFYSKLKNK